MVSIITINYNTTALTVQLLRSILRCCESSVEVIVVDNASAVNPEKELTREFPWIKFIRSEINLGFAGGNNLGMESATGDYFFFINNDTEFFSNIIPRMEWLLKTHPSIGMLCPVVYYFNDPRTIQYAGFTPIHPLTGRNKCNTSVPQADENGLHYTHFAHGAAMMIPRSVVELAGGMNENYFLYFEELDWSETIRRKGFEIAVDTQASFYHKESQSTGPGGELKNYLMARNRILFMRKFSTPLQLTVFWIFFLLIATPRHLLTYLLHRNFKNARAFIEGIIWNLKFPVFSMIIGYKFNHLRHG